MQSMLMTERMGLTGMGMPNVGTATGIAPSPAGMNMMMVPQCTMTLQKVNGGMKITCQCDDPVAATTLQNLCKMMPGGMLSCCTMLNGMMNCCCNMIMGTCTFDTTNDGVTCTCISGDAASKQMIQACCDCVDAMMKAGCMCCLTINSVPICYGCCA